MIKSKKLTLKVNGKTYTAKTNSKGVATFIVKITNAEPSAQQPSLYEITTTQQKASAQKL
ncbi:MAG: hypothetical protein IJ287_03430 [Methanobrevibacter sp.]|nr:hypothetical protein [Methanobrevibacter sp.]